MTAPRNAESPASVIALLTDFGVQDPFVGVMKAVIWARCPGIAIVDLTHAVAPQNVVEGAFWLERAFRWLPPGAVCVAVVDPGVGTERRALAVAAHGRTFLGPDNGLLAAAVASDPNRRVYEIDVSKIALPVPSRTFHGRDVFAPAAAEIAAGRVQLSALGPIVVESVPSPVPDLKVGSGQVEGTVVTIDRFGNLITNISAESIAGFARPRVLIGGRDLPVRETYADVPVGQQLALVNAFGTIEVAERDGNAASTLGLGRGASAVVLPTAG